MADQETLLPIQDEIIGYATEAYGLAVDLQDLEEAWVNAWRMESRKSKD